MLGGPKTILLPAPFLDIPRFSGNCSTLSAQRGEAPLGLGDGVAMK
jgi:hypothetical protein